MFTVYAGEYALIVTFSKTFGPESGCAWCSVGIIRWSDDVYCIGDAYRYTLQPIYHNVDQTFRCHLQPRPVSEVLYQLWFYITVPGTGFETERLYTAVSPHDVESHDGRVGRHRVEFVTVASVPAVGARDGRELVLRATRSADDWRFTTIPVTTRAGVQRRSSWFELQHVADNVAVTAITFAKPFAHSTSTWVASDDDQSATRCYTCYHCIGYLMSSVL